MKGTQFDKAKLARLAAMDDQHRADWIKENKNSKGKPVPYNRNWWAKGGGAVNKKRKSGGISVVKRPGVKTGRKSHSR